MSLANSKIDLQQAILVAFKMSQQIAKKKGSEPGIDSDKLQEEILNKLSEDLTNAINDFVLSADVDLTPVKSSVPAGIPVTLKSKEGVEITEMIAQTSSEVQILQISGGVGKLK